VFFFDGSYKRGISVVGGASKIFKYFLNNFKVNRVVGHVDRDWSLGGLYEKLGFKKIGQSSPDYKYVVGGLRIDKSEFKKCKVTGTKIWDCGGNKI
jgi:hypothetical protein